MESIVGKILILTSILVGISEGLSNGKHLPSLIREKRLDPIDEEPSTNEPIDITTLNTDESNNLIESKYKRTRIESRLRSEEKEKTIASTAKEITEDNRNSDQYKDKLNNSKSKITNIPKDHANEVNSEHPNEFHDKKEKSKHSQDSKTVQMNNKVLKTNIGNGQKNAKHGKPLQHSEDNTVETAASNDSGQNKEKLINNTFQRTNIGSKQNNAVNKNPSSQVFEENAKQKEESKDAEKDDGMEILSAKLHSEEEKFIDSLKRLSKRDGHQSTGKNDRLKSPRETLGVINQKRSTVPPSFPTEDLRRQFRRHLKRKIRRRLRKSKLNIQPKDNNYDISPVSLSDLKEAVKSSTALVNEETTKTETKLEKKSVSSASKRNENSPDGSSATGVHKSISNTRTTFGRKTVSPTANVNNYSSPTPDLKKVRPLNVRVSKDKKTESEDKKDNVPVSSAELKKAIDLSDTRMNEGFKKKNSFISRSRTSKNPKHFYTILRTNEKTPMLSSLPKLSKSQSTPTGRSYIPLKGNSKAEQIVKSSLKRRKRLSGHRKSNNILDSSMKLSSTLRFTFSTPFDRQVRSRSSVNKPTESMVEKSTVPPLVAPKVPPSRASLPDFLPSLKKIPSEDLMMLNDFFNHAAAFKEKQMKGGSSPTKRQAQNIKGDGLRQEQFQEKVIEQFGSDSLEGKHHKRVTSNGYLQHGNLIKEIHGHQIQEDNERQATDDTNFQHDNNHGHKLNENGDNRDFQFKNSQGNHVENHDNFFEEPIKNPNNLVHKSMNGRDRHVELPRNNTEENNSKTQESEKVQSPNKVERKLSSDLYAKELLEFQRKAIEAEEERLDDIMKGKEQAQRGGFNSNEARQTLQDRTVPNNAKQHEGYRMAQGLDAEMKLNQGHQSYSNQRGPNPNEVSSRNQAKEHKVHTLLEEMGRRWKENHQSMSFKKVSSQMRKGGNSQENKVDNKEDSADQKESHHHFDLFDALRQITKHRQNTSSESHSSRWNLEKLTNHNNSEEHNEDDSNYLTDENDGNQHLHTNNHDKQNDQNKHSNNANNNNASKDDDGDITQTRKQGMKRHRRKMFRPSQGPTSAADETTKSLPKDSDDDDVVEMAFTPSKKPFIPTTTTPIGHSDDDDKPVEVEISEKGKALVHNPFKGSSPSNKIQGISKTTNTIQRSYGDLTGQPQGTNPKDTSTDGGDLVIYDSDDDDGDAQDVETVESVEKPSDISSEKMNTTVQRSGDKKVNSATSSYNLYGLKPNSEDDIQDDKEAFNNDKDRNNDIEIAISKNNNGIGKETDAGINGGHDSNSNLNNNSNNDYNINNEEDIPRDSRLLYILGDPEQITKKEQSRHKIEDMVNKVQLNNNPIQGGKPQQPILNRNLRAKLKAMEIRVLEAHQKVSKDLEEIERHLTDKYETLKNSISQAKTLTKNMDNKINDTVLHVLKLAKTSADTAKSKVRLVLKAATALTDIEKHMGANETRNIAGVIKSRIAELPASKHRAYQRILAMNNMITKMDAAKIIAESNANSSFTNRDQVEQNMADIATNVLDELTSTEDELNKDTKVEIEDEKEAERKLEDAERRNYMVAIKSGEALKKIEGYLERLEKEETKLHNIKN